MHLLPLLLSSLSAGIAAASAIPSKILFSRADRTSPVLVDDSWKRISDDYSARRGFASVTRINRWTETIPNDCYKEAFDKTIDPGNGNNNRRCPSLNDLNVFEVWFSDAAEPWLVCRCKNSYITEGELLKKVGRIPIGVRQHTRYIMMFRNGGKGVNGLANSRGDVIFFGKTDMKTYIVSSPPVSSVSIS